MLLNIQATRTFFLFIVLVSQTKIFSANKKLLKNTFLNAVAQKYNCKPPLGEPNAYASRIIGEFQNAGGYIDFNRPLVEDTNIIYSNTNSKPRFSITTKGTYLIIFSVLIRNSMGIDLITVDLVKNEHPIITGASIQQVPAKPGTAFYNYSYIFDLNIGDTIAVIAGNSNMQVTSGTISITQIS
ncbi:MAG: hypothetical protein P4L22_06990 [Candidatus Babeliales bacterium]|nr:hypothetical protein [Candidatus Babeliales bacterium]